MLMIVQVAPVHYHVNETLCSLNFALRVKSVELGAASRRTENADVAAHKARLAQYEVSQRMVSVQGETTYRVSILRIKEL